MLATKIIHIVTFLCKEHEEKALVHTRNAISHKYFYQTFLGEMFILVQLKEHELSSLMNNQPLMDTATECKQYLKAKNWTE